jgi:hypothetical protein
VGSEGVVKQKRFNSRDRALAHARQHLESTLPKDVGDVLRKIPSDDGFLEVFRKVRVCREDIQVDALVSE